MDAIYDFLTLRLSSHALRAAILEDDALLARIAAKLPRSTFAHDPVWKDSPMCAEAFAYDDFDLRRTLTDGYYCLARLFGASHAYDLIYALFEQEYPGLERSRFYHDLFVLAVDAVPECVESPEAGEILFDILIKTDGLPARERKAQIKARIAERFHLNGTKKRPRWIQSSQWPVANGRPMRFVAQKKDAEVTYYTFEDADTGERRVVMQSY